MPKAATLRAVLPDHAVVLVFLRTGQGWSQAQLCRVAGISPTQLNDFESGRKTLTRERLDQLAAALGLPPERVDETLDCLAANRAAAAPPGEPLSGRAATRRQVEVLASRAGRLEKDHARELLNFLTVEGEALVARQRAERQMARLKKHSAGKRRLLVETVAEFRNWALAEAAALESVRLAPNHPQEAREWAELAVQVSDLVPGEETWRRRLQGWTRHFLANALRACNDLPAAEKTRARGRKLWEDGALGDPGLLAEAWIPALEATSGRISGVCPRLCGGSTRPWPWTRASCGARSS